MAEIEISSYPIRDIGPTGHSIAITLGEKTPSRRAEVKTVADCKAALATFAEEMKATGKPWELSVRVRTGRKPSGFDKAYAAKELRCLVNPELAEKRQ